MNPFVLILAAFEALVALGGLIFLVYSFTAGYGILGPMIGLFTLVIFGLFTYGTWHQGRDHIKRLLELF